MLKLAFAAQCWFAAAIAGTASARADRPDVLKQARQVIDKSDAAFNAHDGRAMAALLDDSFFGAGPTVSGRHTELAEAKQHFEHVFSSSTGTVTRERLTLKGDDSGDVVWYLAEYTVTTRPPPGAMPTKRLLRESGVLVKRGGAWRFALLHATRPERDPGSAE